MYSIEVVEHSEKFFKKILKEDAEIISNKIYSLRENPFRFLKRLKGYKLWRLRILKYRVIIDAVVSGNRIIILKIGYIKNIYDEI